MIPIFREGTNARYLLEGRGEIPGEVLVREKEENFSLLRNSLHKDILTVAQESPALTILKGKPDLDVSALLPLTTKHRIQDPLQTHTPTGHTRHESFEELQLVNNRYRLVRGVEVNEQIPVFIDHRFAFTITVSATCLGQKVTFLKIIF